MKQRLRKGFIYLALGFIALFGLRLGYGYLWPGSPSRSGEPEVLAGSSPFSGLVAAIGGRDGEWGRGNIVSEKIKLRMDSVSGPAHSVDQKYERVASINAKTNAFDDDEGRIRGLSAKYQALIQFEQSTGLKGNRRVSLAFGVPPQKFDSMVAELKEIGEMASVQINKTDKTNEFKELNAKRASLEKTRDALASLKSKGGRIEEFTNLENRILEIEEQIQSTGVRLGDYDEENALCTVNLTLEEKHASVATGIPFGHRVGVALAWTIKYCVMLLGLLLFGSLLTLMVVLILQRLNVIPGALPAQPAASAA